MPRQGLTGKAYNRSVRLGLHKGRGDELAHFAYPKGLVPWGASIREDKCRINITLLNDQIRTEPLRAIGQHDSATHVPSDIPND